ncbi:hypothetical protein E4U31_000094 [Claviceps sp. LM219 group G6]|nr:hypothetical protein E4U31_000094 [Claviceps sp. LM219 group G6]
MLFSLIILPVIGSVSDDEAPAADHGEPEPDDMRPQQQISNDPAPLPVNTVSSDGMLSDDDGNGGDYAPVSPVDQTSGTHRTRVPSSGQKGGNRQGSVSARLDQLQSTVSKLVESVEALRDAHYATQAALAAQAAQHPPWQHHANAEQHQNYPVASWPTQQSETAQSNAQPPQTGRVSQFVNSHCAGPNFLASQSNEHMASGYTAGLHYPATQRPR